MRYNICFIGFLFLCVIQTVGATPPEPISSSHDVMNTEFRFNVLEDALSMKANRDELKADREKWKAEREEKLNCLQNHNA
jgi:hypothetical protein